MGTKNSQAVAIFGRCLHIATLVLHVSFNSEADPASVAKNVAEFAKNIAADTLVLVAMIVLHESYLWYSLFFNQVVGSRHPLIHGGTGSVATEILKSRSPEVDPTLLVVVVPLSWLTLSSVMISRDNFITF